MAREISWTLNNGKVARVMIELRTSETLNADGYKVDVSCCEMDIRASVDGIGVVGYGRPQQAQTMTAKIGKLGIAYDNLDKINAAIAEIEATPEWQAKIAQAEQAERESAEYDKHRAKMKRVMGY